MFIYNGKFSWQQASNETITIIFPAGFAVNDPVSAFFQWSNDPIDTGFSKSAASRSGVISGVTDVNPRRIHVSFNDLAFDASITTDYKTFTFVTMFGPGQAPQPLAAPSKLVACHINTTRIPSVVAYTGKLQWADFAIGETVTLIVPYGVVEGAFFGLFHRWSGSSPVRKDTNAANDPFIGSFKEVKIHNSAKDDPSTWKITAWCECSETKGYKCDLTFGIDLKYGTFVLSYGSGDPDDDHKSEVTKFSFSYGL